MIFRDGVSIIGSGNIAWNIAHALKKKNILVNCVVSRSKENARQLANTLDTFYSEKIGDIPKVTDLVLICVTDNQINSVSKELVSLNKPVAHTAGSVPMSDLAVKESLAGVFYPFQTFTKDIMPGDVDFPVCIEAGSNVVYELLETLGNELSEKVIRVNSEQRKKLHLSGVMANNFTNFLFTCSYNYLENCGLDPALLMPLILQTGKKMKSAHPSLLQTGPAVRGGTEVINEHKSMLRDNKDLLDLYAMFSEKIMKYYKKTNE